MNKDERKRIRNRNSLPDYASPLMSRVSLGALTEAGQFHPPPFSILFNMSKTKARSAVAEKIIARAHAAGQEPLRYSLVTIDNGSGEKRYQLRSNQQDAHLIAPAGQYSYVILADHAGGYELRIGKMHHYYLADKSIEVYAAGEILFAACDEGTDYADILLINPYSGGYHTDEIDQLIRCIKDLSIVDVLEQVGLPAAKFKPASVQSTMTDVPKRRLSI